MDTKTLIQVLKKLHSEYTKWQEPIVTQYSKRKRDPFKVLISTIISQRTKDDVTGEATDRLFKAARNPRTMGKLPEKKIAELIYPAGFYRTKAKSILSVCVDLLEMHGGNVPDTIEELVKLKGVGRKTANLVLTLGYGKLGICVDTHVHRISNRFGYVRTKTPDQTEFALRKKLPEEWWIEYNDLLVAFGQNLCRPIGPHCDECPVAEWCERKGVKPRSRG
jgi:endonuclease-3